jgi:hypothetical protein
MMGEDQAPSREKSPIDFATGNFQDIPGDSGCLADVPA